MNTKLELTKKLLNILETYFYRLPEDVAVLMIEADEVVLLISAYKELREALLSKPLTEESKTDFLPIVKAYITAHEAIYGENYFSVKFSITDNIITLEDNARLSKVLKEEFKDDSYIAQIGGLTKDYDKKLNSDFRKWMLNELTLNFPKKKTSTKKSSKKEEVSELPSLEDTVKAVANSFGVDPSEVQAFSINLGNVKNIPSDEKDKMEFVEKCIGSLSDEFKKVISNCLNKESVEEQSKEENKEFVKTASVNEECNSYEDTTSPDIVFPAPCNHECTKDVCECSDCEENDYTCECECDCHSSFTTIRVNVPNDKISMFVNLIREEFDFDMEMTLN